MIRILLYAFVAMLAVMPGCGCRGDGGDGPDVRTYKFRAISGFSMGGVSAAFLGLRHPDKFDIIAPLGTAMDSVMFVNGVREAFGGFCVPPEVGRMCPKEGSVFDYEHMNTGGPNAGGFDRKNIIHTAQDGIIAYGNVFIYNPDDPYLPPGVPRSYLERTREEKCTRPVVLQELFDARYNPDGAHPAITFCDGDSGEPGVFDPEAPNDVPVEVALAIDLNGNGKRDSGEPVLMQDREPFDDTGADGLPSEQEAGYDPRSNPDPAADDWDLHDNPLGTEGDGLWQPGEPYEDVGLDGVPGDGPYDFGEGNGQYDRTPAALKYDAYDPHILIKQVDLARLDFYLDVGCRDHLGFREMTEHFVSTLRALDREVGVYQRFLSLLDGQEEYDATDVDFTAKERDVLVIYGNPDASEEAIRAGDGGHVGTVNQTVHRLMTMVKFVSDRLPDGNTRRVNGSARSEQSSYYSEAAGREIEYSIFLPPDYEREGSRYPVLYMLHGLGMKPSDLQIADLLLESYMASGMMQKLIVVYPDARCLGEECNSGNFYIDQAGGWVDGKDYETAFVEDLVAHIDATYSTRSPETF